MTRRVIKFDNLGPSSESAEFVREAIRKSRHTIIEHEIYVPKRLYISTFLMLYLNHGLDGETIYFDQLMVYEFLSKLPQCIITPDISDDNHQDLVRLFESEG